MEKPVQWMTLQELRDELDRTRPAWEDMDVDPHLPTARERQRRDQCLVI